MPSQKELLRVAFFGGAVTDALAILPMLVPSLAQFVWGFDAASGTYRFAMGYSASLMLGWTLLLIWAFQRPVERSAVAALTVLVVWGLVLAEIAAAVAGLVPWWRLVPTWLLQAVLLGLFAAGFHYDRLGRLLCWKRP